MLVVFSLSTSIKLIVVFIIAKGQPKWPLSPPPSPPLLKCPKTHSYFWYRPNQICWKSMGWNRSYEITTNKSEEKKSFRSKRNEGVCHYHSKISPNDVSRPVFFTSLHTFGMTVWHMRNTIFASLVLKPRCPLVFHMLNTERVCLRAHLKSQFIVILKVFLRTIMQKRKSSSIGCCSCVTYVWCAVCVCAL